jgi:hypothetical protein
MQHTAVFAAQAKLEKRSFRKNAFFPVDLQRADTALLKIDRHRKIGKINAIQTITP